jgi:cytosine/uracil/thiamine/allantoin permease
MWFCLSTSLAKNVEVGCEILGILVLCFGLYSYINEKARRMLLSVLSALLIFEVFFTLRGHDSRILQSTLGIIAFVAFFRMLIPIYRGKIKTLKDLKPLAYKMVPVMAVCIGLIWFLSNFTCY